MHHIVAALPSGFIQRKYVFERRKEHAEKAHEETDVFVHVYRCMVKYVMEILSTIQNIFPRFSNMSSIK